MFPILYYINELLVDFQSATDFSPVRALTRLVWVILLIVCPKRARLNWKDSAMSCKLRAESGSSGLHLCSSKLHHMEQSGANTRDANSEIVRSSSSLAEILEDEGPP